jgi:hypothetical protein
MSAVYRDRTSEMIGSAKNIEAQYPNVSKGPNFIAGVADEINFDNKPIPGQHEEVIQGDLVEVNGVWQYEYTVVSKDSPEYRASWKASRKDDLKAKRQAVVDGGTTIVGDEVRTDAKGRASLVESLSVEDLVPGQSFDWNTQDGGWVTLSYGQLKQYQTGVNGHVQGSFTNHRSLDAELDAATTLEEIDAVDIDSGWPGDEDEQ